MKKILVFALTAIMSVTAFGMTIDEVFSAFPKADNVQEMTLDKAMLGMAMSMGADQSGALKNVEGMRFISIEEPTSDQLAIAKQIMKSDIDGFEVMVDASEEGQDALILTQGEGEVVKKMLIMAIEGENIAFVLLEGDIDPNNAGKMINFGK